MQIPRLRIPFLCGALALFPLMTSSPARAGSADFSMTATDLNPSPAVDQGVPASATLTLQPLNGFAGQVNLQCSVSPPQAVGTPTCQLSQSTVTPPAQPSVTLTTFSNTPATLYTLTVTATSPTSTTVVTVILTDTVVVVNPDYTILISTALSPTSVHAGSGATAVLTITPVSYSGTVTPVCTAITPAVQLSPICTFNPPTVTVAGATPVTTTLTISTFGPNQTTTTSLTRPQRALMAIFLLPGLAFCGCAFGRPRQGMSRLRWLLLAFMLPSLLLLPSCNSMSSTNTSGNTPNNSYSITISGVDTNQVGPSNSSVSVNLTVD